MVSKDEQQNSDLNVSADMRVYLSATIMLPLRCSSSQMVHHARQHFCDVPRVMYDLAKRSFIQYIKKTMLF